MTLSSLQSSFEHPTSLARPFQTHCSGP
jgi:hypothetical protein